MTSPEYQAPTWVNEDDPAFIEGVSPDLGAGYLNQLSGAVEDHGQRLGAITPVVTYLNANAISQDAGDNRYILNANANGFAPAEATANAFAALPFRADNVTTTGAAVGDLLAATQVSGGAVTEWGLIDPLAVTVVRDAAGRIASVTEGGITETLTRDAAGRVATITRGDVTKTISRDSAGRVEEIA